MDWLNRNQISHLTGKSYFKVNRLASTDGTFPKPQIVIDKLTGRELVVYKRSEVLNYFEGKPNSDKHPQIDNALAQQFIRGTA